MEALLRREKPERKYRRAVLSDIKPGDVLIKDGKEYELLDIIDLSKKERAVYVFRGFSVRRGGMRRMFDNEQMYDYPNVYLLKK